MPWFKKRSKNPERVITDTSPNGVYSGLRQLVLTTKSADLGITPSAEAPAWGVLMESRLESGSMTLVAIADGSTSLYLSNGGGFIGAQGYESVRRANTAWLTQVNQYLEHLKTCETFPVPEPAHTVFYVLTDSGILCGGALENDLGYGRHPLSPVFHAGHEVITQLRLASEASDAQQLAGPEEKQ
jgi:hypothetical protein